MDGRPAPTEAGGDWRPGLPGLDPAALRPRILERLIYQVGGTPGRASARDWFLATALAARDVAVDRWRPSNASAAAGKHVCYLSLEFLVGRLLSDTLGNLGLTEPAREALAGLGVDLDRIAAEEPDAALGNGGLGRLAACFLESMATVGIPAYGYGIRYEHGLFRQVIADGRQHEVPEEWLSLGNPWEFERSGVVYEVGFGGVVEAEAAADGHGGGRARWRPAETVRAVAYDTPVAGWGAAGRVNTLRLWSARADDPLHLPDFNRGDHVGAHAGRMRAEAISRVLYPGDETPAGQELRLRQEYFFVSASLQDLLRRHARLHGDVRTLADHAAVQMNDTHPALAVVELMRLLVDVHGLGWDEAWGVTRRTLAYTNHTLMPEALETWPVPLVERLLPRHMQIVYLINARHLDGARALGASDRLVASVSLIDEHHGRRVRMGHLAFVGSHRINGVSALHTELMRRTVFSDLDRVCPGRIVNETNGITFRRWLHRANPGLTSVLVDHLGERVLGKPEALAGLAAHADDADLQRRVAGARLAAKVRLARLVDERTGVRVDPEAIFDVQVKRIHEYKRQLLNLLHAVALYNEIRAQPTRDRPPRVKILAGKAAASYHRAKLVVRLAHDVGRTVNADPAVRGLLKVVFLPNYNVSLAEAIMPAADLSEQISTAGMEASGTGNMKLALNGALTVGTRDGANIEIGERVGEENAFFFGLTAEEVEARRRGGLDARDLVAASDALAGALDAVASGVFSPDEPGRYRGLVEAVAHADPFMVAADFDAYAAAQERAEALWRTPARWWRASLLNTAHMGWFSSDRTVRGYARDIWRIPAG
jgi:starch phosphorylase